MRGFGRATLITLLILLSVNLNAQGDRAQAPAELLSEYVTSFTGDFNYNLPLATISGPNGESFPLDLGYSGGIRVNQSASWVGLGWNLNIGEITRQTRGLPDDFNDVNTCSSIPRMGNIK